MNVCRSCPLSERSCLYEIQNRKKHCAGNVGSPTVFPKAVLGIVPKPLSGRDGGSSDRPDRLRLFRGRENVIGGTKSELFRNAFRHVDSVGKIVSHSAYQNIRLQ